MTKAEFNRKWNQYILSPSRGLMIDSDAVANYLDLTLQEVGGPLKILQIKEKFGKIICLIGGLSKEKLSKMEEDIYRILEEETNKQNND